MSVARLLAAALLGVATSADAASTAATEQVKVALLAEDADLVPGEPAALGLRFELADHWHVYWSNPGDSGEAPSVTWRLPSGFAAGAIEWPAPERISIGPLANYGYEGTVLLPVALQVPRHAAVGRPATIGADVSWLVCRAEECIPGTAALELSLPVAATAARPDPQVQAAFATARRRLPAPARPAELAPGDDARWRLRVPGLTVSPGTPVGFFPEAPGMIEHAAPQRLLDAPGGLELELVPAAGAPPDPAALSGVVVVGTDEATRAHRVLATPSGASLPLVLLLAAAGGLLLNLMPCVFPVLSLKVLSFVQQAAGARSSVRAHGWAFAGGVIASFWVLAGGLLALRAGGEQLGWGFQLQSPAVVAALAAVMVLLGLNLAGVFEMGLALTRVGGVAQRTTGLAGSFWTGALATVVATPCTAPFMGAALGFALTRPAPEALLVFTALGLGMAAPYLVLAHAPAALRLLPRPGAWMETLKTLLAFPLFATALWLVWVFHLQVGSDAAFALLAAFLVLALGVWLWGRGQARGAARAWRLAAVLVIVAALPIGAAALVRSDHVQRAAPADDPFWDTWSPEREDALRAAGQPLFVNYTAAWCLTCQVNERFVFAATEVREAFRGAGITALKADWTDRNAAIADALDRHGRSGVPLYVLYAGRPGASARILPQIPTRADVLRAIGAATHPPTRKETSS